MGMIQQCVCDECGLTVPSHKTLAGATEFPTGWIVAHWQIKRNGGYDNIILTSYCNKCGKKNCPSKDIPGG